MIPGSRVIILNLRSKPELNGTIGVVLQPTPEEEERLISNGRVKVNGGLNPLSLKRENLTLVDESTQPPTDWTLLEGPTKHVSDLANVIRTVAAIGNLDRCDEFVKAVLDHANHQRLPMSILRYDAHDPQLRTLITNNVSNHCIYFFRFDQIGHHFVMEVHQGKARLFQSFIKDHIRSMITSMETGFSARQWVHPQPHASWPQEVIAAHHRYGGGQELSYLTFIEVLDIIREIQDAAKVITNHYRKILPTQLAAGEEQWERNFMNGQCEDTSPVGKWADHCFYHPWMTSMTEVDRNHSGDILVFSNGEWDRDDSFCFAIPASMATPFRKAVKKLHGMEPSSVNYIMLFRFLNWERLMAHHPTTGENIPIGWTFSAIMVPH